MDRLTKPDSKYTDFKNNKLQQYENTGFQPEGISNLRKAFVLACRVLDDEIGCPAAAGFAGFPECENENDPCEGQKGWECWQRYIRERVASEQVCRWCGCTQNNACEGGCWWVEDDLCSKCAGKMQEGGEQNGG